MKLSKANMLKILTSLTSFGYTKEEIENIVFREYNNDINQKCDLAFIFGNQDLFSYRADEAIKLYEQNLVSKLIVSGGIDVFNKDRKTPEAYKMRDFLLEKDIPPSDIIVESESINTTQNIQNTLALLENKYNYDINKLTWALVSSDFHLRRCFALFTNALNSSQNLTCIGAKDGITDIDSWYNNPYGKRLIITEALALCYNAKLNKIKDIDIPSMKKMKRLTK